MLARIIDTSEIDLTEGTTRIGLEIDLRRMDRLDHLSAPKGSECYMVVVGKGFYSGNLVFEVRYGKQENGGFVQIGKPVRYNTESLPLLDSYVSQNLHVEK